MNLLRPAVLAVASGLVLLPAPPAFAVSVSVSPTSGLNPAGATVSVSGSGFDAKGNNGNGIYVVFGPKAGNKDAGAFGAAKWIRPGAGLSEKGSFSTSLSVKARYTDGHGKKVDCTKTACYIITMAAHGSPDRSQDTFTRVTFKAAAKPKPKPSKTVTPKPSPTSASPSPASPSPSKTIEKPKPAPSPKPTKTTAAASPAPAPTQSVESLAAKPAATSEKDSGTTWPYWAAAVAVAAAAGALVLRRRRQS